MRQQHLVSADCCQDHSAVVCQTPMPYAVIEVEQVLELGMKRLHGRLAAPVEGTPTTRFQERPARWPWRSCDCRLGDGRVRVGRHRGTCGQRNRRRYGLLVSTASATALLS